MIDCEVMAIDVGKGDVEGKLGEIINVDGGYMVDSSSINFEGCFLFECLLELIEECVFSHSIDES